MLINTFSPTCVPHFPTFFLKKPSRSPQSSTCHSQQRLSNGSRRLLDRSLGVTSIDFSLMRHSRRRDVYYRSLICVLHDLSVSFFMCHFIYHCTRVCHHGSLQLSHLTATKRLTQVQDKLVIWYWEFPIKQVPVITLWIADIHVANLEVYFRPNAKHKRLCCENIHTLSWNNCILTIGSNDWHYFVIKYYHGRASLSMSVRNMRNHDDQSRVNLYYVSLFLCSWCAECAGNNVWRRLTVSIYSKGTSCLFTI